MSRFSVKFWGTRGSVPTPGPATVRYGGNTACVEVRCNSRVVILDAGTGIRPLGLELEREGVGAAELFISHPHIDHLQGFPFFTPAYNPEFHLAIYMPDSDGRVSDPFHRLMEAPHFPVIFADLPAQIAFHPLETCRDVHGLKMTTHPLNHPGGSRAIRLEYEGKILVYMTDHEPYSRKLGPGDGNAERDRAVVEFARGADLLIREAQYTEEEYVQHRGWGHGTYTDAVSDAMKAEVRQIAIFHHDPSHDDNFLEAQLEILRRRAGTSLSLTLAREGERIDLA